MAKAGLVVTGIKQLDKKLKKLEQEVSGSKKVLRRALRDGTKVIQAEVKSQCPVDEGDLKASYKVRAGKRSRKALRYNVISTDDQLDPFYASFVEFGHLTKDGDHIPAQPHLRPAYDTKKQQAADVIKRQALQDLDKLIKSLK